jgi:hypothetical protein
MRAFLIMLILAGVVGCSTTRSSSSGRMLRYPDRTLADWQPEKAAAEAEHDLAVGTPKIYISGTIAAFAPGVGSDQYPIVRRLPNADAGIGCNIEDADLRKAQFEYARRYNEYIVQHLPNR